ncbi:MAG: tRNA (N6-threonylcarbamoyladenosine(37)-N6)-methyltransferase TrmO [Desulfobacteraceae bacterium]|nr:tRNA (N6-threonylcarbamoyladenosine(37)-N6)-methyltransferase TrmO [Desulfobacteraceae bacterium]
MKIEYKPIGIVRTPFKELKGIPKQPSKSNGVKGIIEVYPQFQEGLKDLDGFSNIILLCHFHKITEFKLSVVPSEETEVRGLFATRSPRRPNPIGFSVVQLNDVQENKIMVSDLDILDGTPVLDIKPYFREFDSSKEIKTGWISK